MDYLLNGLPYFPGTTIFGTGLFADGTTAAPSISFSEEPTVGFYRSSTGIVGFASQGARSLLFAPGGVIYGQANFNSITLGPTGSIALAAAGTNQNITLTPSGTGAVVVGSTIIYGNANQSISGASGILSFFVGPACQMTFSNNGGEWARFNGSGRLLIGTTTDSANGLLQVAGAISTTGRFQITVNSGTLAPIQFTDTNASGRTWQFGPGLATGLVSEFSLYDVTGVALVATFSVGGKAKFFGTVTPQLATTAGAPAYVKGAIYFDTTLNKLRVGGATAWETITSA